MDIHAAHALSRYFPGDRSTILYSGVFLDEHTARLIALGEAMVDAEGAGLAVRGRLAFIMVEAYQNIVRHRSTDAHGNATSSLFMLRSFGGGYLVNTANPVPTAELPGLERSLALLEGRSSEELKSLYLEGLRNEEKSERGGAGLGLIEMTRRSGRSVAYQAFPSSDKISVFHLQVALAEVPEEVLSSGLERTEELRELFEEHEIVFMVRGISGMGMREAVLRIVARDLDRSHGPTENKRLMQAFWAASDWLREMAPLTTEEGSIAVAQEGMGHTLSVSVTMRTDASKRCKEELERIMTFDAMARRKHYREALLASTQGQEIKDLGLLELVGLASGRPMMIAEDEKGITRITVLVVV